MAERRIGTTGLVVATSLAVIAVVSAVVDLPLGATGTATTPQPRPGVAGSSNGPSAALTGASPTSTGVAPSQSRGPDSVSPAPPARIPSPSIAFESRVHDYQVRYPAGWTLTPAAQRRDPDLLAMKDYRWRGSARRLAKAMTLETFVTRPSANACPAAWEPTAIDGRRALQRAGCGRVDAAVMVGQMGYRFALEGSGPYERVLLFGRIAATIELPEPFVSTVHDFTLMIPPAWEVERGTAPTEPDRFYGPRDLRFTVTMRRESAEVDPVAWAAGHFDRRSSGPGQYCRGQSGMRPVKDHQFRRWTVDGHPAALRSACGHVDAAVAAGKRTYELSLMSRHVGPGGDDAAFALLSPRIDVGTPGGSGPVWTRTFRSMLHG